MEFTSNVSETKILDEYDVTFTGGHMMTVSVCKAEGDTIDFETTPHAIEFHLVAKKALTGSELLSLPPENITLFTSHILAIQHRTRVIQPLSAEQKAAWDRTVKQYSNTIQ